MQPNRLSKMPAEEDESDLQIKDSLLLSKFYNPQHLSGDYRRQYDQFLDQFLPNFFKGKKVHLFKAYDREYAQMVDYYISFGKISLQPTEYCNQLRMLNKIQPEVAYKHKLNKEILVKIQCGIEVYDLHGQRLTVKQKRQYPFFRMPLLVNSSKDPTADGSSTYYFIINGTPKLLNRIMEKQNFQRKWTLGQRSIALKTTNDAKRGTLQHQITLDFNKGFFNIRLKNTRKAYKVFQILKLLNIRMTEVLQFLNQKDLVQIALLGLLEDGFKRSREQIIEDIYNSIHDLKNYLKFYSIQDRNSSQITFQIKESIVNKFLQTSLLVNSDLSFYDESTRDMIRASELLDFLRQMLENIKTKQLPFIDHPGCKRVHGMHLLMEKWFLEGYSKMIDKIKVSFMRQITSTQNIKNLNFLFKADMIKKTFRLNILQTSVTKQSNADPLIAANQQSCFSGQRKVVSRLNKSLLHHTYRALNPLKIGRLCPITTPYSKAVGLVEYLALGAKVSQDSQKLLHQIINQLNLMSFIPENRKDGLRVYLEQRLLGVISSKSLPDILHYLYQLKRKNKGQIGYNFDTSQGNLYIRLGPGRILKPFIRVKRKRIRFYQLSVDQITSKSLDHLILKDYITYLDPFEELSLKIAQKRTGVNKQTQLLELQPTAALSYTASAIAHLGSNTAHRANLTTRSISQALGSKKGLTYNNPKAEYLCKANPSILGTYFDKNLIYGSYIGQNMILAFLHGQNEEDACYVNQDAIQRGLLDHVILRRYGLQTRYIPQENRYEHQIRSSENFQQYSELDKQITEEDGIPPLGHRLERGDSVLERETQQGTLRSIFDTPGVDYSISQLQVDYNKAEKCNIQMIMKAYRNLEVGNKLGTNSGLKTVVSRLVRQTALNLPKNGVQPSLFFSNHVITSRMALGSLVQILLTKGLILDNQRAFNFCFLNPEKQDEIITHAEQTLIKNGYEHNGKQTQYDPILNRQLSVFAGPIKIMLLQHHSKDKAYVRSAEGGVSFLTRQPGDGRSVKGGLKIGQMEANAITDHVATNFLKDKLGVDTQKVRICVRCKVLTNQVKGYCELCNNYQAVNVELPYAFILLNKLLRGAHIEINYGIDEEGNLNVQQPFDNNQLAIDEQQKQFLDFTDQESYKE